MCHQLKVYFSFLVVCMSLYASAIAQYEINKEAIKLVDSANAAFCKNDTAATIAILESIEKLYPTDAAVAISNKALADLYIAQGRIKEAKEKIWYGISYKRTTIPVFPQMKECSQLLSNRKWLEAKAESCVSLSRLYIQEKQFDSSLYYLQQAQTTFNPYKLCGNGYYMYCVYLSPFFADHYLAMGDTTKAIARLLDFFMNHDGNTELITRKLKALLLQKYTQEQITAAVKKGLRNVSFTRVEGNDDTWYMNFTWFGLTTQYYAGSKSELKEYKKLYISDPSAKMLCDASVRL